MTSFWSNNPFEELITNATSELRPSNDVDLSATIDIADHIRSKKVAPKDAVKSFRKRLTHPNPNVVLLALQLCEFCVQNAGKPFVSEVSTNDFLKSIQRIAVDKTSDHATRTKARELIQIWAIAARNDQKLQNFTSIYEEMKSSGVEFPSPPPNITSLYFESSGAPDWTESTVCERCRTPFSLTNRKHHCRQCGGTFCQLCSSRKLRLPHLGINEPVRVCDGCYSLYLEKKSQTESPRIPNGNGVITDQPEAGASSADDLDEEFQLALRLSKEEAERNDNVGKPNESIDTQQTIENTSVYHYPQVNNSGTTSNDHQTVQDVRQQTAEGDQKHITEEVDHLCSEMNGRMECGLVGKDATEAEFQAKMNQMHYKLQQDCESVTRTHYSAVLLHDQIQWIVKTYDSLLEARIRAFHNKDTENGYNSSHANAYSMDEDLFADASAPDFSMATQTISDAQARVNTNTNHMNNNLQIVQPSQPVAQTNVKTPPNPPDMPLIDLSDW
ncbi:hypothetical protein INT44_006050 [Umbelopsis vinacea]|uniref:Vacuolar protein sorting-associated protein 27 n=1 Tax=Umbelopsis vinacea TaxID=44442 RepID=A0A8H7ULC2_9FUNG|nr:hypothetical protein INT44_006050 [Umbelopsis vinacea]